MPRFRVVATDLFEDDLDAAVAYYLGSVGVSSARSLLDEYDAMCGLLAELPGYGANVYGTPYRWRPLGARQRSSRRGAKSRTAQKRDPIALALDLEELEVEPYWRDQIRSKAFGSDLKMLALCLLSVLCWGGFLVYSLNDVEDAGWGLVIVLAALTLGSLFLLYLVGSQSIKEYRTGVALPRVLVGQDKLVYFTGDHDYQVWDSVVDGIKCICQISDYEVRNGYTVEDKVIVVRGHFNEEVTDPSSDSYRYKTVSTAEFSISRIYKQEDKLLACLDRLKRA